MRLKDSSVDPITLAECARILLLNLAEVEGQKEQLEDDEEGEKEEVKGVEEKRSLHGWP